MLERQLLFNEDMTGGGAAPEIQDQVQDVVQADVVQTQDPVQDAAPIDLTQYQQMFGSYLPEGTELIEHEGKPCVFAKVNGVPRVFSLEDVVRNSMINAAAEEKLEQAKLYEKQFSSKEAQYKQMLQAMVTNPKVYYQYRRQAGIPEDVDYNEAQALLEEAIKRAEMSPEQKELEQLKAWKAEQDRKFKEEEDKKAQTAQQQEIVQLQEKYANDIISELKAKGYGLSEDKTVEEDIFKNSLYYMLIARSKGLDNFTPKQAVERVEADLQKYVFTMLDKMPDHLIRKSISDRVRFAIKNDQIGHNEVIPTSNSLRPNVVPKQKKNDKEDLKRESINDFFGKL